MVFRAAVLTSSWQSAVAVKSLAELMINVHEGHCPSGWTLRRPAAASPTRPCVAMVYVALYC
jgi:hypothetical protein